MKAATKFVLGALIALTSVACDDGDGGDDGSIIVLPAGGMGGDGVGGQGGDGVGGQGGGVGGQGGGIGGEGGAGGGEGGAGGGQGGAGGGQGGAGGGEGGAGGGCTPMCDGRVCGPDGCGGECGPGCGDAEVCADGACMPGECPDGTFQCGGDCANLLTDPNHCGSCGKSCADEWPQEWTDAGFTFESANIQPICEAAECTFMCAESDVGPGALIEDVNNCGACGNTCESDTVNSLQDACANAQCGCVLTLNGEDGVLGRDCGEYCELDGYKNCRNECCPDLAQRQVVPASRDNDEHQFILDLDRNQGVEFSVDCDGARNGNTGSLIRYLNNGLIGLISRLECDKTVRLPILAAGHYAAIVQETENGPISLRYRTVQRLEDDFAAPGMHTRETAGSRVNFIFTIAEAGEYLITLREDDGICEGRGRSLLLNPQGELLETFEEVNNCVFDMDFSWRGELAAGQYVIDVFAHRLDGNYTLFVEATNPDPGMFPLILPYDGFGRNGSDTVIVRVAAPGSYSIETTGRNGEGCPGDTFLSLRDGAGNELANDDDGGASNCSRVEYDLQANTEYRAVVTGYNNRAIDDGAVVVNPL